MTGSKVTDVQMILKITEAYSEYTLQNAARADLTAIIYIFPQCQKRSNSVFDHLCLEQAGKVV